MTLHGVTCPHCTVGVAVSIAEDENGTTYKCFNCGLGFTKPASKAKTEGTTGRDPAVYPTTVAGEPGIGAQPSGKEMAGAAAEGAKKGSEDGGEA